LSYVLKYQKYKKIIHEEKNNVARKQKKRKNPKTGKQ